MYGCDLLENSYLCGISNNKNLRKSFRLKLWFAWKFVPLWYQQQLTFCNFTGASGCDLLENSYLCGISNNKKDSSNYKVSVVICLKIRTFVVSATTESTICTANTKLWFAWKFVPLWYQQQHYWQTKFYDICCDLLENSYLCGISNNDILLNVRRIRLWFAWKFVPLWYQQQQRHFPPQGDFRCDLLENSYLCGISNNYSVFFCREITVVICLKIRTFVVSATTPFDFRLTPLRCDLLENSYLCGISNNEKRILTTFIWLWFAWKFVPLWYQQQQRNSIHLSKNRCDLLENSYLCGISNNQFVILAARIPVVICLKIRTFVVSATTLNCINCFCWCCDLLENSYLCGISNNNSQLTDL